MTARIQLRASQTRICAFVDIGAERGYPGAMRPPTALRPGFACPFALCLRGSIGPQASNRRPQRGLRCRRFADISTQPPHRNIRLVHGALVVLSSVTTLVVSLTRASKLAASPAGALRSQRGGEESMPRQR